MLTHAASTSRAATPTSIPLYAISLAPRRAQQKSGQAARMMVHAQEKGSFQAAVDMLLGRAASNVTRGTCTCLKCKGSGKCDCPMCEGKGLVEPGKAGSHTTMNVMKHAVNKVEHMLGNNTRDSGQEWLRTNRCTRCHGTGLLACVNCSGSGVRYKANGEACEIPQR